MASDPVSRALKMTLDDLPISIRQLAREAGIAHTVLIRSRDGDERLGPEAARKVVAALRRMGAELESAAERIEKASSKRGDA